MAKVKFNQTSYGTYGRALAGDEVEVTESEAKELVKNGVAEEAKEAPSKSAATKQAPAKAADRKTKIG